MKFETRLEKYNLKQKFDLAIIGGGINGAGIARDASLRGLKVILLEKNDFASGCTAHSTRLIHGGLRYLEHLEFDLVRESLKERETLLKSYPHLVNPLGLFIPSYRYNKLGLGKLNLGMLIYEMLSGNKSLNPYKNISKSKLDEMVIAIDPKELQGGVFYYDAQASFAERIVLENILSAERSGAVCLNHAEVVEVKVEKRSKELIAKGLRFKDFLNHKRPIDIQADHIINVSGPWVDLVNSKLRQENTYPLPKALKREIGGSKGSHIVVRSFPGGPKQFGIYNEARSDGRPFFVLPFKLGMNEDLLLIGTTDIFLAPEENLDKLKISEKEIDYLLNETNLLFPTAFLNKFSILKTYCGVRPLPYLDMKDSTKTFPGKITRKHFIHKHHDNSLRNYYSIAGGKITSFRKLSQELVDLFTFEESSTHKIPTVGANFGGENFYDYLQFFSKVFSDEYLIDTSTALHLIMLYGSRAKEVLELCKIEPSLSNRIHGDFEDIEAQIVFAIREEKAYTVEDILDRRLSIGLLRDSDQVPDSVIKIIAKYLGKEFNLKNKEIDTLIGETLRN
jgi:glycerol-3-phosphate dehydrogenase